MESDNIFSGLKVVDLASFIAGPSAAVILADFGADVIEVEPPAGDLWIMAHEIPPQPRAKDAYAWHLDNVTDDAPVVDARRAMRQREKRRDQRHLTRAEQKQIIHRGLPDQKALRITGQLI